MAVFKTCTDSAMKIASKKMPDDRILVFLQRLVESTVAGLFLLFGYFLFSYTFGNYSEYFTSTFILLCLTDVVLGGTAIYFNVKAIRLGELSVVAPMSQLTPAILLFTSPLMIGDKVTVYGFMGVLAVVVGSYILGVKNVEGMHSFWEPLKNLSKDKGVKFALLASVLYGVTSNVTKLAAQQSDPVFLVFFVGMITTFVFLGMLLWQKSNLFSLKLNDVKFGAVPGVTGALGSMIQVYAVTIWAVPYVIAVKRLSTVFSTLVGIMYFKEQNPFSKIVGASVMVLGTVLIVLLG